jgi:HSP20 family molecular chaperone IbpA
MAAGLRDNLVYTALILKFVEFIRRFLLVAIPQGWRRSVARRPNAFGERAPSLTLISSGRVPKYASTGHAAPSKGGGAGESLQEDSKTTMNRSVLFDSPFLLGFENTRALVERASKAAESYPPYNVEDRGEGRLRITLAVAGFTPEQLEVTLEDRQLSIAGRRDDQSGKPGDAYLHRGIAARGFLRTFVLADGMVVEGASLEHGLLHIDLAQPEPERRVQHIPIRTAG